MGTVYPIGSGEKIFFYNKKNTGLYNKTALQNKAKSTDITFLVRVQYLILTILSYLLQLNRIKNLNLELILHAIPHCNANSNCSEDFMMSIMRVQEILVNNISSFSISDKHVQNILVILSFAYLNSTTGLLRFMSNFYA